MSRITLIRPDDWHVHLRDGAALEAVIADSIARFGRVLVMPNLKQPVVTLQDVLAYRERILAAASIYPASTRFLPLMTLYLTDKTVPAHLRDAYLSGAVMAAKLYPAGATTNSQAGVSDLNRLRPCLEMMAEIGMPLSVHGEVVDTSVDIFDREAVFIDQVLSQWVDHMPRLKIVLEHITTANAVEFVLSSPHTVAATVTAHHLLLNRNALFVGGIRPHHYCLPVLKRERHRLALLEAVTSGSPQFFLGTDSAPHAIHSKESACGCAGIYTAHAAIELYAEAFDSVGALDRLEGFASRYGADFYGLPYNADSMTLVREPWQIPESRVYGEGASLVPFRAGDVVNWRIEV